MILSFLTAIFCGLAGASERLECCKELVSLGYPEPRPLGEFLGRGQDGDGRFVLNSAFEHNFSSCNTDTLNRVVAPDGVHIIALYFRTMHHRYFDVKEWEENSESVRRKYSAYARFSLLKWLRYYVASHVSQYDWLSPYGDAGFSLLDSFLNFVEAHVPLSEWLTFRGTFNSTTTATPYNKTTHTLFVDGQWAYRDEAYRLITSDIGIELNCDFVSNVLGIMEKVELGLDAVEEIARLQKLYGREICTEAVAGADGTFTYNATHNTTFQNVTFTTEPGRILRSLPCLLGFALHCSLNHALQANNVAATIFASTQWLLIWLFGDFFAAPLPTPVFVISASIIWTVCASSAAFASGVISVVLAWQRQGVRWRELLPTVLREISRWPREGIRLRELLLTVLRENSGCPSLGFSWRFLLRTLVLPLALAVLANKAVEMQQMHHEPVIHRSVEESSANDTRYDLGDFIVRIEDGGNGLSGNATVPPTLVAEVQRYAMLRCEHKTPIYRLITSCHFPGVSWRTVFETWSLLHHIGDHCQKPSFSSVWKAPSPQSLQKLSGYNGRCTEQWT